VTVLPGKKYQFDDFVRIGKRHKWLIVIPFVVLSVATLIGSQYLPNRYRSQTLILVVPQRVPENYVKATVTTRIEDRLQSIRQQILSRTRLERTIEEFDLYASERKNGIMEDIVERMRWDIDVDVVKGDAFRIAFTSDSPHTAQKVTERLASLFIDENLKDREVMAVGTNQFLEGQLTEARQRLIEFEKRLETYRLQHAGELPSQMQSNLQALQSIQVQIQSLVETNNQDRERKIFLERVLADIESTPVQAPAAPSGGTPEEPTGTVAQQLEMARKGLAAMELRLKPTHPDIRRIKRVIADLEVKADEEALRVPVGGPALASRPTNPQEAARVARIRDYRAEVDALTRGISAREAEEKRLRGMSVAYQARVDVVPARESELAELTRDYDTMTKVYQDLLAKKQDSQVAANLERRQIGEQFKVLDVARLPERPFSPNRFVINAGGMMAGLVVGIGLVFLLEFKDRSLRSVSDVSLLVSLPVLATVPVMLTVDDKRRGRRRRVIGFASAAVLVMVTAAAGAWKFRFVIESWVR
jgi:polysaccharide chain length determinant protein (PEP-CTERM system associated)